MHNGDPLFVFLVIAAGFLIMPFIMIGVFTMGAGLGVLFQIAADLADKWYAKLR